MESISRGLGIDGPDRLVNQPFTEGESKQALFAQKIAEILIGLAKIPRSLTKLPGKADLFKSGVHELPGAFHGGGKFFRDYSSLARSRDGLHMRSKHKVTRGRES